MTTDRMTRRSFLARVSGGAAALGTSAAVAQVAGGANERLSIGVIGCGGRGTSLMRGIQSLAKSQNVEITAICDVWKVNLNNAAGNVKKWFG